MKSNKYRECRHFHLLNKEHEFSHVFIWAKFTSKCICSSCYYFSFTQISVVASL